MKAYISDYTHYCAICNKPTTETHHLVYSGANRKLSDNLGLYFPICRDCHSVIHSNGVTGKMSKIIGQLVFELNDNASKAEIKESREKFREIFGMSFL